MAFQSKHIAALFSDNPKVREKPEFRRADPGFGHRRPAVLLVSNGVCSASFNFSRTPEIRDKNQLF